MSEGSVAIGSWSTFRRDDYNQFKNPACVEDTAVSQLIAKGVQGEGPGGHYTQKQIDAEIKTIVDHHNRQVAMKVLGKDATPEQIQQKIAELERTQQRVDMGDGKTARVIPAHAGNGKLGSDGWDAHEDGWDLVYDGETVYVPVDMSTQAAAVDSGQTAQPGTGQSAGDPKVNPTAQMYPLTSTSTAYPKLSATGQQTALALAQQYGDEAARKFIESEDFNKLSRADRDKALQLASTTQDGINATQKFIGSDGFKKLNASATGAPSLNSFPPGPVSQGPGLPGAIDTSAFGVSTLPGKALDLALKESVKAAQDLLDSDGFKNLKTERRDPVLSAALTRGAANVNRLINDAGFIALGDGNAPRKSGQDPQPAQDVVLSRYNSDAIFAEQTNLMLGDSRYGNVKDPKDKGEALVFLAMYAGRTKAGYGTYLDGKTKMTAEDQSHALQKLWQSKLTNPDFLKKDSVDQHREIDHFVSNGEF